MPDLHLGARDVVLKETGKKSCSVELMITRGENSKLDKQIMLDGDKWKNNAGEENSMGM